MAGPIYIRNRKQERVDRPLRTDLRRLDAIAIPSVTAAVIVTRLKQLCRELIGSR
jgi:hypothetical protein